MTFTNAIKAILKERNMKQWELAKAIGMGSQSAISAVFRRGNLRLDTLIRMAEATGYDVVLRRKRPGAKPKGEITLELDEKK